MCICLRVEESSKIGKEHVQSMKTERNDVNCNASILLWLEHTKTDVDRLGCSKILCPPHKGAWSWLGLYFGSYV